MYIGRDVGYTGPLVSLAGMQGKAGTGLIIHAQRLVLPGGVWYQYLDNNPKRVWVLINNEDDGPLYVAFTDQASATADAFYLPELGVLQIDKLLPWTGTFSFYTSGIGYFHVTEAELAAV